MTQTLKSSIIMIRRVIKFIPNSEYMKIYDALFKSHLCYCITISSWGAVLNYKLQGLFAIQKRCVRLFILYGTKYSYDHSGFYGTCARVRTYQNHIADRNYCLEHTKPLFNKYIILNLHNLYVYHTFINLFKILKTHTPISLHSLFNLSQRGTHFLLHLPRVTLEISKNNFVFHSNSIWNKLIINILQRSLPGENGMVVRGSSKNSDLCATLPFVKKKAENDIV